jgi:hypothetical protein
MNMIMITYARGSVLNTLVYQCRAMPLEIEL